MTAVRCQMQEKDTIHIGRPEPVILSRRTRFLSILSRHLHPRLKRFIKKRLKWFTTGQAKGNIPVKALSGQEHKLVDNSFKTGDIVRVLPIGDIRATLDSHGWLRGCAFMPEMEQYCGTVQHVFKPVERFLDERDYTVRKTKGIVILENNFCQGVAGAGRCDRSCFYFWRVEWLERLEKKE
jgi:hypothetical protein